VRAIIARTIRCQRIRPRGVQKRLGWIVHGEVTRNSLRDPRRYLQTARRRSIAISPRPTSCQYRGRASLPFFVDQARADSGFATGLASGCDWYRKQSLVSHGESWLNLSTTIEKQSPGDDEKAGSSHEPKRIFEGVRGSISFAAVAAQRVRKSRRPPGASFGPKLALQGSVEAPKRGGGRQPDSGRFSDGRMPVLVPERGLQDSLRKFEKPLLYRR
jgi:hypothetical protein